MKIAKYIILELLIIVLSLLWGTMMTNDHQSGEICITPAWGAQIQNYLEFGWNNYFHWFRKDEQAPCRYETFTIICFYILAVPLYTGLKIYGKNYLYQALSWQVIIPEWLLYIFVYLYFLFKQKNIILTLGSLGNAILGAILFFLPLIIYGSLISSLFQRAIHILGWGGWIRTNECRHQKPMPYHLATPQYVPAGKLPGRSITSAGLYLC